VTYSVPRISAMALSAAALMSLSTLSAARADSSAPPASNAAPASSPAAPSPAPTPPARPASTSSAAAAPSLDEPAPTPGWAEAGPRETAVAQHPAVRHYTRRHYAYRDGHRYYSDNPVGQVAMGVAGGAADLGSVAAYPFYCFPNYGSCRVRVPYRY
jgi:hypothetical protein